MNHHFPWSHPVLFNYIIYITNIPIECQSLQLKKYLRGYGDVAWMRLFNSKFPSPKYAHLIFSNLQSYKDFLNQPVHMLDSAKLRVTMWKATALNSKFAEDLNRRKVFVKNLPTGFRFESVRKVLSRYGNLIDIDGVNSTGEDTLRNIVIAIFEIEEGASACIEDQQRIKKETGFKVRPYTSIPKKDKPHQAALETSSDPALQFDYRNFGEVAQGFENGMVPYVHLFKTSKLALNSTEFDNSQQSTMLPTTSDFMNLLGEFAPIGSFELFGSASFEATQLQAHWLQYQRSIQDMRADHSPHQLPAIPLHHSAPRLDTKLSEQPQLCIFKIPWKIAQQQQNLYSPRHLTEHDIRYNLSTKTYFYPSIKLNNEQLSTQNSFFRKSHIGQSNLYTVH